MSYPTKARLAILSWLESLRPSALEALATEFATDLEREGLTVYDAGTDETRPVTPMLTPELFDPVVRSQLRELAPRLLSAAAKVVRGALSCGERDLADGLFRGFTDLEVAALRRDPGRLSQVATARLDVSPGSDGGPRVIEINATIPAMQGYSDMVAHGWVRAVARARGLSHEATERFVASCGSNTGDLLASLLAHYERAGGRKESPSILIVSRNGDAQRGELTHYVRAFSAAGYRAKYVSEHDVGVDVRGYACAQGEPFDLVYRHIFARRISPGSALADLLRRPGPTVVLNPILSPLEVKGLLALMQEIGEDPAQAAAWGVDEAELHAITTLVPWTRRLCTLPTRLADGSRVRDLAVWAADHPDDLVLKRSWDYGGRSVILGTTRACTETRTSIRELFGSDCTSWREMIARAAREPHAWVVQEYLPSPIRRHLAVERSSTGRLLPVWRNLFTDLSVFANFGVSAKPSGGASRASSHPVVNIRGGGGLAPLIPIPTLDALLAEDPSPLDREMPAQRLLTLRRTAARRRP